MFDVFHEKRRTTRLLAFFALASLTIIINKAWVVMLPISVLMDTFFSYTFYLAGIRKVMIETVEITSAETMTTEAVPPVFAGNRKLSDVDKKMLQTLLTSSGRISSLALSRKLEIPLTTVQRRRKRLESEFLEVDYSLRLDKLGWRNADLLISTSRGAASSIGKELLSHNAITRVCRSIGEHTIDLHAQAVFKNNTELLNVIDWIKRLDGVKDVVWTEPVEVVGKKQPVPEQVLKEL